eukprot:scaffold17553_cov112-Isochrysis_galbana.AAC.6
MLNPSWALWWLHFPKCGTSLRQSVLEYPWSRDRDTSWPQGNHQVLFPDIGARISHPGVQVVAMFRQPEARLESAYFHMRDQIRPRGRCARCEWSNSPIGCCWTDWGWSSRDFLPAHRAIAAGVPPAAAVGNFTGCMTSMVLGKGCMSRHATTPAHAAAASALVDRFLFVGDTDRWNLSLCLFNAVLTGRRFLLPWQAANSRPTSTKLLDPLHPSTSRLTDRDPIDGALWAHVSRRFIRDLIRHHVSAQCCPVVESVAELPPPDTEPDICRRRGVGRRGRGKGAGRGD